MQVAPFFALKFYLMNFSLGPGQIIRLLVLLVVGFAIRRLCTQKRHVRNVSLGFLLAYVVCELYVDLSALNGGLFEANLTLMTLAFQGVPILLSIGAGFLLTHCFLRFIRKEVLT